MSLTNHFRLTVTRAAGRFSTWPSRLRTRRVRTANRAGGDRGLFVDAACDLDHAHAIAIDATRQSGQSCNPSAHRPLVTPIERIPTDPTIADRLSVTPSAHWQQINDDDLIQSLATAGQSVGLVQMNGQTILLTPTEPDQNSEE